MARRLKLSILSWELFGRENERGEKSRAYKSTRNIALANSWPFINVFKYLFSREVRPTKTLTIFTAFRYGVGQNDSSLSPQHPQSEPFTSSHLLWDNGGRTLFFHAIHAHPPTLAGNVRYKLYNEESLNYSRKIPCRHSVWKLQGCQKKKFCKWWGLYSEIRICTSLYWYTYTYICFGVLICSVDTLLCGALFSTSTPSTRAVEYSDRTSVEG